MSSSKAIDVVVPTRPLPDLSEPDTAPFWAATKSHRLIYQVCTSCGEAVFHPRRHCGACGSAEPQWHESAGRGTVYSYTVIRQHGRPYFRDKLPYALGFIDLDEGFRMLAEIDAPLQRIHVGLRVIVGWEDHPQLAVPIFRPA
ncbi:Zn-ribbon domain-containing OB-fold protein [Nocardia sp. CA-120079]|uniref:Zn-ribbon domain-containing OB-fold protein n=1 Tax=Nocardia sp. CA-120079 TaxID=3239974 RepID=UPI003D98C8A1